MTLAQGPRDDQSRQDERVRRGASNSTVTICGAEVDVALCLDVQAYVPRSLENLSTLSAEFVERLAERAISFNPQTIQLALRDILSASLILDRVTVSQEALYELYSAIESAASLSLPDLSRGGKPVEELAIGYLVASLVVDSLDPEEGEGRRARDVFKGHVISHVKGQAFEEAVPDGFEEMVRSKLMDCALANPKLAPSVSQLLGDWDMLAVAGPEATLDLADEYFMFGKGSALIANHKSMEESAEKEGQALVPKAVEILTSEENRYNWENSLSAMEDKIRGHRTVQIALTFNEARIDSFSFSQYVYAVATSLGAQGYSRFVFEEDRLVPASMIHSLQLHRDERGLQTIANLTADFLNLPLNASISSFRNYLQVDAISVDKHAAAWIAFIDGLREKVRESRVTVYTRQQYERQKSDGVGVARFEGGLLSKYEGVPLIRISALNPSPGVIALNSILHHAVSEAGRRDGFGDLMSAGIDQRHIHEVYNLTDVSTLLRSEDNGEHYRVASCADIDLWVFVAVDGDAPEGIEDPVDIETDVPTPALR